MTVRSLRHLFEPERVVWVGPKGPVAPWALTAEANLWEAGFGRPVLALRSTGRAPEEARIGHLSELPPGGHWLAVICLPQPEPERLLHELAAAGCRAAVIIGGGSGPWALPPEAQQAVLAAARALDIRVIGPDRIGLIVPSRHLNAGSATCMPLAGDLAFVTQSDSIATSMLEWAAVRRLGFSSIVSLGDSTDVELGDILDYLALDATTRAILIHLEGIADARRFMSAARAAARVKPVVVIKAGRQVGIAASQERSAGIRLHRDRVYDAAFARAGIVRVETIEELFAAAGRLANAVRQVHGLRNGRMAILTNGHAPAELAADTLLKGGGVLVRPTARIYTEITRAVGHTASLASSIDLGLEADARTYEAALDVLLEMPGIDTVLVIHAPAPGIDPEEVARAVATRADRKKPRSMQRPVIAAWLGERSMEKARGAFEVAAIPHFTAPEPAVRAFLYRVQYERRQFVLRQTPSSRPEDLENGQAEAERVVSRALAAERRSLNEAEAMAVLEAYGIAGVPTRLAPDLEAAMKAANEIGYPVALKIVSAKLPQKSAAGGVALDIANESALLRRGQQMLDQVRRVAPDVRIEGLLVQRMERSLFPIELYIGMELDPTFGPVIVLGHAALGPTSGELAYLLPPLDSTLAHAMLDETGIGRFLVRQPNGGMLIERVVETLVRLSQLVVDLPTVRRVAIDPLLISRDRLVVLDAHIDLAPVPPGTDPNARLAVRPYPRELEQTARLRDGRLIRLRPIRPEDAPALKALFEALTPEDRRRRLFSSVREISDEFAARLTQIDYDREMVLVAVDPEHPDVLLGGARIAADADNRRAEYSVTVRSDQQGLGLGRICFERILDYARSRGIEEVWGSVLAENEGMLRLAERLGFTRRRDPEMPDVLITTKRLV